MVSRHAFVLVEGVTAAGYLPPQEAWPPVFRAGAAIERDRALRRGAVQSGSFVSRAFRGIGVAGYAPAHDGAEASPESVGTSKARPEPRAHALRPRLPVPGAIRPRGPPRTRRSRTTQGLVGCDRDGHVGERAADMLLVGDVVHAAELGTWVCANELRKQLWEVRYAMGRPDLDVKRVKVATDEVGQRANSTGIAVSLTSTSARTVVAVVMQARGSPLPALAETQRLPTFEFTSEGNGAASAPDNIRRTTGLGTSRCRRNRTRSSPRAVARVARQAAHSWK